MDTFVTQTRQAVIQGDRIDRQAALRLLDAEPSDLWQAADAIRRHFMGDHFDLCSIINARSGNCTENCRFCAQSARHHTGVNTYTVIA
ncbi:MAG: biotin synthase BioB, partial [Desulfobulbus sp.]|nr:biotin synthase BioB [Desulfobulbus sp.]